MTPTIAQNTMNKVLVEIEHVKTVPDTRASTRAMRWVLAMSYAKMSPESFCADFLGGRPSHPMYKGAAQAVLASVGVVDTESLRQFLSNHFSQMCKDYLPGGNCIGSLPESSLELLRQKGTLAIESCLPAQFGPQAIWVVHHAIAAKWLCPKEGWQWALRAGKWMQQQYNSFAQFSAAYILATQYFTGTTTGQDKLAQLFATQSSHANGAYQILPFDENLDAQVPFVASAHDTLRFSTVLFCPRCDAPEPMTSISTHSCGECGLEIPIQDTTLQSIFWAMTIGYVCGNKEAQVKFISGYPELSIAFDCGEPKCAWCDSSLKVSSQQLATTPPKELSCPKCGAKHSVGRPPDSLWELLPLLSMCILPVTPPVLPPADVYCTCAACNANFSLTVSIRSVECPFCQSFNVVPDDVWYQLHPRKKAPAIQVILPQNALDRAENATAPFSIEPSIFYSTDLHLVPYELKPLPVITPTRRYSTRQRWLLALGAVDVLSVDGDFFQLTVFPLARNYQVDMHALKKRRYPDISKETVLLAFDGQLPPYVAKSPVAILRHLLDVGRLGVLLGWLDENNFWSAVNDAATQVCVDITNWQQYGKTFAGISVRGEHPRKLASAIQTLMQGLWHHIPWGGKEIGTPEWESINVKGTLGCSRCGKINILHDLTTQQVKCVGCGTTAPMVSSLPARLQPHLFAFRRNAQTTFFVTDYTDDGIFRWRFTRATAECLRCRNSLVENMFGQRTVGCPACGFEHQFALAHQLAPIDPGLFAVLQGPPPKKGIHVVPCPSCHGDLEIDGQHRLVDCKYCSNRIVIGENIFRTLRGVSHAESTWMIFDHQLAKVAPRKDAHTDKAINGDFILKGGN